MKRNQREGQCSFSRDGRGRLGIVGLSVLLGCCLATALAQAGPPGSLDTSFNANLQAVGNIYALARHTNGSVIIGGTFKEVNGSPRRNLARLDVGGNLDSTFAPDVNGTVNVVVLQPDGNALIGGNFTAVNGARVGRVARLSAAGQLDTAFQEAIGDGADARVCAILPQADGKVLVAGRFANFKGAAQAGLVRVLPNGYRDGTYRPGLGTGSLVFALAVQPDSRVIIGGWFSSVSGTARRGLARLNTNGTVDTSFKADTASPDWINVIKLQQDGRILVGGSISEINSASRNQLARLNPNGSVDLSFAPGARLNGEVISLSLDDQGRIMASGFFDESNGIASRGIARFQPDGCMDQSLVMAPGVNGVVRVLIPAEPDSWLAAGCFDTVNGFSCSSVVRLGADGGPDPSLLITTLDDATVHCLAVEADGRLLVGGHFNSVDGIRRNGVARLHANGRLDPTFDPGYGIDGTVYCLARDTSGGIRVGGSFNLTDGHSQHNAAALLADGSPVDTYRPFEWFDAVYAIAPLTDGSLLAGGHFWYAGGVFDCIARLKPTGALDLSFPLVSGVNNDVRALLPMPDGRVFIGGLFTGAEGAWHKGIARLRANGSLDTGFKLDLGDNAQVYCLQSYPLSKVLVGGSFTAYKTSGLLRVASDGSVDTTLSTGSGPDGSIYVLGVQADSKIVAAGNFTHFNGAAAHMVARLNPDGSIDPTFSAPNDMNGSVMAVVVQPSRGIVLGGGFSRLGGRACSGLARLVP